jgi:glycosyltransferase involved in cell wall biosynthesis
VVGISLLTLVPGIVGGSETYARELVRALARVGELQYTVFTPKIAADAADGLRGKIVRSYPASRTMPGRIRAMALAATLPRVRRELEPERLELIHFPLCVMLPRLARLPAVVTMLDIQHEIFPRFFSPAELAYRKIVYGWSLRGSRLVISISEHVKQTLVERLGVRPERVRVIPLGLDHDRFRPPAARRRLPFLLYPANPWPHKNHRRLFEALAILRRHRPELRLIVTGSGHEGLSYPSGVETRGRVTLAELVELYQTASALVFPSLYEGFGQPPLEAMACGCPVAASRAGALPEVCGDAVRYFDPRSPGDIASAVEDVLERSDEFAARGIARAARFSWEACARDHERVYRDAQGGFLARNE